MKLTIELLTRGIIFKSTDGRGGKNRFGNVGSLGRSSAWSKRPGLSYVPTRRKIAHRRNHVFILPSHRVSDVIAESIFLSISIARQSRGRAYGIPWLVRQDLIKLLLLPDGRARFYRSIDNRQTVNATTRWRLRSLTDRFTFLLRLLLPDTPRPILNPIGGLLSNRLSIGLRASARRIDNR